MMNNFLKRAALVAIAATLPSLAHADFVLRVDDGGANGVVVTDNGPGDIATTLGVIAWMGALGTFAVNVTTGLSKPALPGSSFLGQMLTNADFNSTGAGTIRLTLEDTGFGGAAGSWTQTGDWFSNASAPGSTINAQNWVNASNFVPDLSAPSFLIPADSFAGSPISAGLGASSGSTSSLFTSDGGAFSMFQQVTVNVAGAGHVGFGNTHTAAIPEPETYAMMLAGLGLMGFIARRRKQNAAA